MNLSLLHSWNLEPAVVLSLVYGAGFYALGTSRLWHRAGTGAGVTRLQVLAFAGALLALSVALVSPLDTLASVLFSAHMLQHMLLVLVAAPLLVLSAPGFVSLWALPVRLRRAVGGAGRRFHRPWQWLSAAPVAWSVYVATLWLWHIPSLYSTAVTHPLLHAVEHLSFLLAALLFWWVLLHPLGRRQLTGASAALYLFLTSLQASALGALLTFAPRAFYPAYAAQLFSGLTPLQDQQLAGLVMWVPGGVLFTVLAAVLFGIWLHNEMAVDAAAEAVNEPAEAAAGAVLKGGS